jgi:hypothetical protein
LALKRGPLAALILFTPPPSHRPIARVVGADAN